MKEALEQGVPAEDLRRRARWLVHLRWGFALGALALGVGLRALGHPVPLIPYGVGVGALLLYNAFLGWRLRGPVRDPSWERWRLHLQGAVDLGFLSLLLHLLGGLSHPFWVYYLLYGVAFGILLSARDLLIQMTLALAWAAALAGVEWGWVPPPVPWETASPGLRTWVTLLALGTALGWLALLVEGLMGELRFREARERALAQELAVQRDRLQEAYQRCQELGRARVRSMMRTAHALRSPLGALRTLVQALLRGSAGVVPEPIREALQRVDRRLGEMLVLVEDLLRLARAREHRPRREPVDWKALLCEVVARFQPLAEARGLALTLEVADPLPPFQGDPGGLEDLVANLVSNGIKYTPPGGQVRVGLYPQDQGVVLEVSDTGIGLTPEEQVHLFEEFYRSPRAVRMSREGTGLGLAFVRAVVEAHRGQIHVEGRKGQGATFRIVFSGEP